MVKVGRAVKEERAEPFAEEPSVKERPTLSVEQEGLQCDINPVWEPHANGEPFADWPVDYESFQNSIPFASS